MAEFWKVVTENGSNQNQH